MKNFSKDKHALSIPWVESPFFYELLKNSNPTVKLVCPDVAVYCTRGSVLEIVIAIIYLNPFSMSSNNQSK